MKDRELKLLPGFPVLFVWLLLLGGEIALVGQAIAARDSTWAWAWIGLGVLLLLMSFGFVVNNPNQAKVVQLFGRYVGTLTDVGFFWGNPFYWRKTVSMRVQTFETGVQKTPEVKDAAGKVVQPASSRRAPSKVNDKDGTPIEIAAVVTFQVVAPAEAVFTVDDYEEFIHVQSDAALRNLASQYRYDARQEDEFSLLGHIDEVAARLQGELQQRMTQAGIKVLGAQISYLAYAAEIAAAMLQRQQAGAIIAARRAIVENAVGMVEHALADLTSKGLVDLDPERKAAMVSNLLVVLCGHSVPQPVLNTGTLHN
ncbi:MAG: SPFH domain-containing protein [Fimbriiglobus sp.]|nr:SPFH domain-containing protein [Fimbriiglobus sp.]